MAVPTSSGSGGPKPPPPGKPDRSGSLFGGAFAFGFFVAAIGLDLPGVIAGAVLLILGIAAFPPAPRRRFSKRAWGAALALGGGLALGGLAWSLLSLALSYS